MNYALFASLFLLDGLCGVYASPDPKDMPEEDTCEKEERDPKVYLFAYGYSWSPYEYLNDDGELMGLGYDITRTVCKTMRKKCEHAVYYDYNYAYNDQGISISINDGWYDALVNWLPTPKRKSSYKFTKPYAKEPRAYIYTRSGSRMDTIEEVKKDADNFGFRKGFRTNADCLGKYLGVTLEMKSKEYDDGAAVEEALKDQEVDVIFMDENEVQDKNAVKRIGEPIKCATGDVSVMYRKDAGDKLRWFDEGLRKIRENKDYEWICNLNAHGGNPGCLEDRMDDREEDRDREDKD